MQTMEQNYNAMKLKFRVQGRSNDLLSLSTLRKYRRSDLLERNGPDGDPIYFHSSACPNYCDYACNSNGELIAVQIEQVEQDIRKR